MLVYPAKCRETSRYPVKGNTLPDTLCKRVRAGLRHRSNDMAEKISCKMGKERRDE